MGQTVEMALHILQQSLRRIHLQHFLFIQNHDSAKIKQILQNVSTILYGTACLFK